MEDIKTLDLTFTSKCFLLTKIIGECPSQTRSSWISPKYICGKDICIFVIITTRSSIKIRLQGFTKIVQHSKSNRWFLSIFSLGKNLPIARKNYLPRRYQWSPINFYVSLSRVMNSCKLQWQKKEFIRINQNTFLFPLQDLLTFRFCQSWYLVHTITIDHL